MGKNKIFNDVPDFQFGDKVNKFWNKVLSYQNFSLLRLKFGSLFILHLKCQYPGS
jgi:hypothetical protein